MSTQPNYSGRRACGVIRYEIAAEPAFVFMYHCRDYQRATGSTHAPNAWFLYSFEFRAVRIASLDNPDQLEPFAEVWAGSKIAWDPLHPTLPKHAGAMPKKDFLAIIGESSRDLAENDDARH